MTFKIDNSIVRILRSAVRDASSDRFSDARSALIVGTYNARSFCQGKKSFKGSYQRLKGTKIVKMVGFDVGHYDSFSRDLQERTVRFVSLDDEKFTFSIPNRARPNLV